MNHSSGITIVTGGLGDIGMSIARKLAGRGVSVTILDIPSAEIGGQLCREAGTGIAYRQCDIRSRADVDAVLSSLGEIRAAIVNAGVVLGAPFIEWSEAAWHETIAVNLTGAFHVAQATTAIMLGQERGANDVRGKICFTGSWTQNRPCLRTAGYAASKAGVQMLAQCMALELAPHGILVNVVAPGAVLAGVTRRAIEHEPGFADSMAAMVPLGTLQSPESVAAAFCYLLSSDADHMTGATLLIDGGLSTISCSL